MTPGMYTQEQCDFLRINATVSRRRLTEEFNDRFGTGFTEEQIKGKCTRLGLRVGRSGCFQKGNLPYNTGTKGLKSACVTSFKKGNRPHNSLPVGSIVVDRKDGYLKIKVAEPASWKHKHVMLYEEANGPVPEGCCVIFADGDKRNFSPANLVTVKRAELLYLNRKALITDDAELTKTAVNIARVAVRCQDLRKEADQCHH